MSDVQRTAQAWLAEQLNKHASRTVTYQRDGQQVEILATIGKSTYQQESSEGTLTRAHVRDYLIDTKLLRINNQSILPRSGDRIREVDGERTFVYEVMPLGDEAAWRYSDVFRLKFRIHTKLVSTEQA